MRKTHTDNNVLAAQMRRAVTKQLLAYIPTWIDTLGTEAEEAEDEKTRVQAARAGLHAAREFLPEEGDTFEGDELIKDLQAMEKLADAKSVVPDVYKGDDER